jgi:hypothetical protein
MAQISGSWFESSRSGIASLVIDRVAAHDQTRAHIEGGKNHIAASLRHVDVTLDRLADGEQRVHLSIDCIARSMVKLTLTRRSLAGP